MNAPRRKNLQKVIDMLEALKSDVETARDEEKEYRDNIPENMQESDRYYKSDEACDNLNYAMDNFDELIDFITEAMA